MSNVRPEDLFETFEWKGQKRYKCNVTWQGGGKCAYDTHDLEAMSQHIREPHTQDGKPIKRKGMGQFISPILDARGNKIVREAPVDPEFEGAGFATGEQEEREEDRYGS